MAELVDALDLGSSGVIHGGSSPFTRTNLFKAVSFFEKKLDFKMLNAYNVFCQSARGREPRRLIDAEVAQLVEHHLAMVGVASSSLVFRSILLTSHNRVLGL